MRLDIVPENPAEWAAAQAGLLPSSVVKVVWGFSMARTLVTAVELGVCEALLEKPASPAELATALNANEDGLRTLLCALNAFGLLRRRDDVFSLKAEARRYLTDDKGTHLGDALRFGVILDAKLKHLTRAIKTGERDDFHAHLEAHEWEAYLRGLGALGRMTAAEVARKITLKGDGGPPTRLLDVAGGHGNFSVALCKKHEGLAAEIIDLPGGVKVGRAIVDEAGMSERVVFREGDLRETDWGEGFDAVLLFNILHNLPEEAAEQAVHKAFAAVRPGGTVAVLEGQHAGGRSDLSFQEGFGELLFFVLSASKTWPEPTLRQWMTSAGLVGLKKKKVLTLPGSVLLTSTRPA
jgi:ubiquinone/menaquinone biosynthesis C-methylase UbiE